MDFFIKIISVICIIEKWRWAAVSEPLLKRCGQPWMSKLNLKITNQRGGQPWMSKQLQKNLNCHASGKPEPKKANHKPSGQIARLKPKMDPRS